MPSVIDNAISSDQLNGIVTRAVEHRPCAEWSNSLKLLYLLLCQHLLRISWKSFLLSLCCYSNLWLTV